MVDGAVVVLEGHVWQGSQVGAGGQDGGGGHVVGAAVVVVVVSQWPHESAHFVAHLCDRHFAWVPHFLSQNRDGLLSWQGAPWRKAILASKNKPTLYTGFL